LKNQGNIEVSVTKIEKKEGEIITKAKRVVHKNTIIVDSHVIFEVKMKKPELIRFRS
jgi:hypothetical protein